jgi:hypothetical protein
MTYWTLGQASKETGIGKSQLSKALNSGKMSFVSKDSSGYQLDPAEVFRVFPPKQKETKMERLETIETPIETQLHAQKIAFLEREIKAMQSQLEKSEAREQKSLEMAQQEKDEKTRLLLLLEKQGLMLEHLSKKETPAEEEKPQKRGLFSWFK